MSGPIPKNWSNDSFLGHAHKNQSTYPSRASLRARLIPLRRLIEMNLDRLLWVGYVVPAAVRFPSIGDHLNQRPSHRRGRVMGRSIAVPFHIQFYGFVFLDLMLFDVFDVDAGVLHR